MKSNNWGCNGDGRDPCVPHSLDAAQKMSMTVRRYGQAPYQIAVLHGGPGAPGYMAPVARVLSRKAGIIEPLQTKDSLRGQIHELGCQLTADADPPAILIGSSWGAVLALFVAAEQPEMIAKLILIGCAVFDAESSSSIETRRMPRLNKENRRRHDRIRHELKQRRQTNGSALCRNGADCCSMPTSTIP